MYVCVYMYTHLYTYIYISIALHAKHGRDAAFLFLASYADAAVREPVSPIYV